MAANLGIGVLVGTIPLFGDIFDIAWKANRRNYRLLHATWANRGVTPGATGVFCSCSAWSLALVFAIPVVLVVWLIAWLLRSVRH